MPNYDFKCNTCNSILEVQDPAPVPCTTCGNTMERIWTVPGIKFNAPGFYSTDK
jgi:putative FmdB family regulatory protein